MPPGTGKPVFLTPVLRTPRLLAAEWEESEPFVGLLASSRSIEERGTLPAGLTFARMQPSRACRASSLSLVIHV